MANQGHFDMLKQGVDVWNTWRHEHSEVLPDLSYADFSYADLRGAHLSEASLYKAKLSGAKLSGAYLGGANLFGAKLGEAHLNGAYLDGAHLKAAKLRGAELLDAKLREANLSEAFLDGAKLDRADLSRADLSRAKLREASLSEARLDGADLSRADLNGAKLYRAKLSGAYLGGAFLKEVDLREARLDGAFLNSASLDGADLSRADLSRADLSRAHLNGARLVETNFADATLTDCHIYGIAAWRVKLNGAKQYSLVITPFEETTITVDNLEVAQFIYLLLNNPKIRDVIDTIAKKAVLILGRFTPERKAVLDALREALRRHGYLPILFDFEKPSSQDITETVSTLAHLSRFVIADLTDASSIPQELYAFVPHREVPVQPILLKGEKEYSMFKDLKKYPWVLSTHSYLDLNDLLASLQTKVIEPAEDKAKEIEKR